MLPENRCVLCHGILNAATMVDGVDDPAVGDVSICVYCGNVMVFDDDMNLRAMTKKEAELIYNNETVLKAVVAIQTRAGRSPN